MTKILKRSLSVLLAVMMIAGIFAVVPISASAAAVTPKYKITINNKVVINSTALPYTTSATNLKNKAGYSSYTVTFLKVYKAKDNIGTISGQNFTINKSGSEQLDIGLKKDGKTGHITPNVVCTPLTACVCEATGYTGYYDGEPHTIGGLTVTSPASGATVKYGTVSGTYNLTEPPTFTEVGTHTVYYQISASGWVTKTGSLNVNILSSYTVTWMNDDGTTLETDTYVPKDATPEYNGNTPVKGEDEINTYTFSGWTDGTNTYGKDDTLPAVTADVTYTATFTAENKAVKNVIALINALPADVTVNDKNQIEAARAAYDALTDDQKVLVTNLDKLTAAETALSAAEKAAADQAAADAVITQINALPADVTVNDKDQIEAARAAYDALTDDQKVLITTETLDKLTASETALAKATADKAAADDVITQINSLPADVTAADKDQIEAARAAYDALTDDQKVLVTNETLDKLTASETALAKATADKAAADAVITQINSLPADVTVNDKDQIEAARAAYEALTDDQKALITTETLDKLTASETALAKAIDDKAAADAVIAQLNALPTDVTVDDKAQIEAARAAYDALTDDQKALITTETLDKLTVAETALAEAESRLNGPQDDGFFYLDDVKQLRYQLIQWHGDYYFINDGDKYAKNSKLYLSNTYLAGTGLSAGLYVFDADGKMQLKNGPQDDGYFYENGIRSNKLYRFVEFEGDWYFIYDGYKYAKNAHLYLSGAFLSGTDFAPGYFDFDADGKYYIPEELPDGANADGYFYINGEKQTRFQLIKYGNDYYFINDNDFYAKNTKLYLSSTYVSGTDLPAGLYEFGADGKMIISVTKNGPQDDGYFYINGARCQKLYRFVEFDGDWYFINDGYKYAKNARLYLGNAFLEGTDFAPGYFVFGADGKLVTA